MSTIDNVAKLLGRIPGIGPRSARRIMLFLLQHRDMTLLPLIEGLGSLQQNIIQCACGNIDEISPCAICSADDRDSKTICIVEDVTSLWAIERSGAFKGLYHVLNMVLSPMNGVGPDDLKLNSLEKRIKQHHVQELIIALNPTVEGRATAFYIKNVFGDSMKCSVLRVGVPMGGELDYLDNVTIIAALSGRD